MEKWPEEGKQFGKHFPKASSVATIKGKVKKILHKVVQFEVPKIPQVRSNLQKLCWGIILWNSQYYPRTSKNATFDIKKIILDI